MSRARRTSRWAGGGGVTLAALAFAALAVHGLAGAQTGGPAAPPRGAVVWDGHRSIPVHLLPLRDEFDELIVPTETYPLPYSARFTCGPCHDYETIREGWHFDAMTAAASGRPGEPWFEVDGQTGTVLPLSYKAWPGSFDPRALGISAWDFTLLFGRHMPGGGPAEPFEEEVHAHPDSRWQVSGRAEVNCLACHNRSGRQDHSEWAKQVLRENLRWAATAAGGLGEVGGMASRLEPTWDVYDGPNLDDHEWAVVPEIAYRQADFDSKHRYFFDLNYRPADDRCLDCHAASPKDAAMWSADADVHTAAGLACADCHRNGLDHRMIRGYEGEAEETGIPEAASFTCRGCHLGESAAGKKTVLPGRLGAPVPKHTGLPLVHFNRLACTTCHSGPKPKEGFTRVRTSRANRLGIFGVATWSTDTPAIVEPVYAKNERRKIAPQRLVWPAFWARRTGKDLSPLRPEEVLLAAEDVLRPEDRVARVLVALTQVMGEDETPVLVAGGFVFAPTVDVGLKASEWPGVEAGTPAFFGIRTAGEIAPLVPDFDPAAEDRDQDVENRFLEFLQALGTVTPRPGPPAIAVRTTLYRLVSGYLDISEAPAEMAGASGPVWLVDEGFAPLAPDFDVRTLTAKAGTDKTLTEEQVGLVLAALSDAGPDDEYVYLSGGRLFELGPSGRLESRQSRAAA
ncbi:MAG TPA: hypothetical protein ENO03_05170, partial [Candidatus Aminicenantes bacterium]|nr:hypothetical protein [Candidatus Aminicenantes bacterium]